jgi:hypothetical protein
MEPISTILGGVVDGLFGLFSPGKPKQESPAQLTAGEIKQNIWAQPQERPPVNPAPTIMPTQTTPVGGGMPGGGLYEGGPTPEERARRAAAMAMERIG